MYKKRITYTDYDGNKLTEDFYFNISERELANMELQTYGGFEGFLRKMIGSTDVPELTKFFEKFILMSYGEKSDDGKRFIKKNGKLAEEFVDSAAYNELYMELISDPNKLADFINQVMPAKVKEQAASPEVQAELKKLQNEYGLSDKPNA